MSELPIIPYLHSRMPFAASNAPLGKSYPRHDKYIRPVLPSFVTEYEERFVWYPIDCYSGPSGKSIIPRDIRIETVQCAGETKSVHAELAACGEAARPALRFAASTKSSRQKEVAVGTPAAAEPKRGALPRQGATTRRPDQARKPTSSQAQWDKIASVLNQLIELHYEENMLKLIRERAQERQLDAAVEFAYNHFQDVLRRTRRDRATTDAGKRLARNATETASNTHTRKGGLGSAVTRAGRERIAVRHQEAEEDVRALCRAFVDDVNVLKRA